MNTKIDTPLADIRIGEVTEHWAQAQKIHCIYKPSLDSTNNLAKTQAFQEKSLSEQLVIYVADAQSAGRGRGQNKWTTGAPGSQLLSTWSFMVEHPPQPVVSPMIGLALYRAASATWPFLHWNLKAPNDLYIGHKKVAGLLLETVSQGEDVRFLVGLGFNVIAAPASVEQATALVAELPITAPLLAQDWISFLERLIFEFSFSLQQSFEELNSTSCHALLKALNEHPHLKEKYTDVDTSANLTTASSRISWQEL